MDLREFGIDAAQANAAAALLHYQPFILDDDRQTGVAYSWLYSDDPTRDHYGRLLFDRSKVSADVWQHAWDANRRLATMYDAFVSVIADVCRAGSYLDIGCNTGYLPVRASLSGVKVTAGLDYDDYTAAFDFLNAITGSRASFYQGMYEPAVHALKPAAGPLDSYDVVSATAILCHVPDPLHFLRAISCLAKKALFLWSGFVESDELLIRYNPENKFHIKKFPDGFDDGTSISLGLLFHAMRALGFSRHEEVQNQPTWLPADWHTRGIPSYQRFRAFLFTR
jgi:SAM-dependent methyltransferase